MEYCFLKGFLVVLLIQHSTSEDLSTSIQPSTAVTLQEGQALPQEQEQPPAEVVPVVAPPSLKEVQQAVQEASEQVEGRGAEEVLKELLERVVEAALVQAEGGGEAKADEAQEQDKVVEKLPAAENEETENETGAGGFEQALEEEVGSEHTAAGEEELDVAVVNEFKDDVEEEKGDTEGELEAVAGAEQEITQGAETKVSVTEVVDVIDESTDTKVRQEVPEETVATIDETGAYVVEEARLDDDTEQVQLLEGNGVAEIESQGMEEPMAAAGGEPEQKTVVKLDPGHEEQMANGGEEATLGEEFQVDELEEKVKVALSDNDEMEITQTVVGEPVEGGEQVNTVNDTVEPVVEDEQVPLVVGEGAAEEADIENPEVEVAEGAGSHGESVIKEESVLVDEGLGEQQEEEEEQIPVEMSHGSEKEDQEVLVISAPEEDGGDVSVEQSPENHNPSPRPSQDEVETEENTLVDETSNHVNEIITQKDEHLPQDPIEVQPTEDNFVKDVLAEPPQAESEEPGEATELIEDASETTETSELGMEAWKIGAISAAAFLVLETAMIIIYILKCRNRNSALAPQRACEEGCVEPEATTGGDCSDDILPAGNGDTQQIAALDPSDVASTLAQNKALHEEENAIAMSDLPPSSTEESANPAGPNSSPNLRTSVL